MIDRVDSKKQKLLHCEHGIWSAERDAGGVVFYEGRFSPSNQEYTYQEDVDTRTKTHAFRTAEWLHKCWVTTDYREPKKDGDDWVIRVVRGRDNVKRFEKQSAFKKIYPDTARQMDLRDLRKALMRERQTELPYAPKAAVLIERDLKKLQWEILKDAQHTYVVGKTADPEQAFQVVFYLHEKGLVTDRSYYKVKKEVAAAKRMGRPQEFRFSVNSDKAEEFCHQFLDTPAGSAIRNAQNPKRPDQPTLWER